MILFGYYFLFNLSIYRFFRAFMDIFVPCLIICVLFLPFALPQSRLRFGSFFFRSGIDQTSITTPSRNSLCLHDLSTYLPLTYSTSQPGRKECFYPVYTRRSNTSTYKNTSFCLIHLLVRVSIRSSVTILDFTLTVHSAGELEPICPRTPSQHCSAKQHI